MQLQVWYGARASQVIHLRWTDVDLDRLHPLRTQDGELKEFRGTITFRTESPGSKGQSDRPLPILPQLVDALKDAYSRRRHDDGYVLWGWRDDTKPARYDSMHHSLEGLERKAQVRHKKGRAFHGFRRTLTTGLAAKLGPVAAAQWIGDTVEVVTKTYIKASPEAQAAAATLLSSGSR